MQTRKLLTLTAAMFAIAFIANTIVSLQKPALAAETVETAKNAETAETAESAVHNEDSIPFPTCVRGWSKNNCLGFLVGDAFSDICAISVGPAQFLCQTHYLRGELSFPVFQSNGVCGGSSLTLCDQTPQLSGRLVIVGDFVFSGDGCRFRGAWKGAWRLFDTNGNLVATGTGRGTLGTSSQRSPATCLSTQEPFRCPQDCNSCYNVTTSPGSSHTQPVNWHVGLEGTLDGTVSAGPLAGSEIVVTLTGMLNSPGTNAGPTDLGNWNFCGVSDGVVLAPCE